MGLETLGLLSWFSSISNGNVSFPREIQLKEDDRKIEEMKRKNDISEKELFLKEIKQASNDKILEMLKPKKLMQSYSIQGGLANKSLWKSKEVEVTEMLEEDKYELVKDEAIKRKLI